MKTSDNQRKTSLDEIHHARSLAEIAVELGLTRQRVMIIERKALMKLKAELERRGLKLSDLTPGA